ISDRPIDRQGSCVFDPRQDAGSGGDALTFAYGHFPFGSEENVDARSEFDKPDAFAACDHVAGFLVADNATRDQTSDLTEHHARLPAGDFAIDSHDVLFVQMA